MQSAPFCPRPVRQHWAGALFVLSIYLLSLSNPKTHADLVMCAGTSPAAPPRYSAGRPSGSRSGRRWARNSRSRQCSGAEPRKGRFRSWYIHSSPFQFFNLHISSKTHRHVFGAHLQQHECSLLRFYILLPQL